jgi:CheY-like chemotaxis protein
MEQNGIGKPIEILLVEDSPGDVRLVQENMKEAKMLNPLNVVSDGVEAMEYLRKQGKYKDAVRPSLVLLDLNLPKKDGREVLAEIKADKELMSIPVVVLTISKAEEDVLKSYNLHANAFITKPVDLNQFLKVTKAIDNFWLTVVSLPRAGK